jgi:tetratricopeptide (TPR) repeat protein
MEVRNVTTFCEYHPEKRAVWFCSSCDLDFCETCIAHRTLEQYGKKKVFYRCPKCDGEAERHSAENTIVPFWNRLPKFFLYPFQLQPLILMILLSIAATVFSGSGLFSFLMQLAVWGVLLKYSFASLKSTAHGSLAPPGITLETISNEFGIVFKQLGIYMVIGIVFIKITQIAGIFLGMVFVALAVLSIPAMIIVLVASNSLIHALNPLIFAGMAWRIGWGYLLMYLFYALLGAAPMVLAQLILAYLPPALQGFLFSMAKSYYLIISYHLMGYVVFQYHEEIGYEVDFEEQDLVAEETSPEMEKNRELMNRANMLVKEGKLDEAIACLKSEPHAVRENLSLAERFYNLLKIRERFPEMLEHAKPYLDLLVKANQKEKLCGVLLECLSRSPAFTPAPSTLFKAAGALNETGKPREAIHAYKRFIKANANHQMIPKAYFLAAGIINEKLNDPRKASGILQGIIKKYPGHEMIPYVERYLVQIRSAS